MKINPWIKTFRSWSLLTLWKICISASSISESQIKLTLQSHWSDVLDPSHFGAKVCLISSTLHLNFFIPLCSHIPILQGEVCNITLVQNLHVQIPLLQLLGYPLLIKVIYVIKLLFFILLCICFSISWHFPTFPGDLQIKKCMQEVFFKCSISRVLLYCLKLHLSSNTLPR